VAAFASLVLHRATWVRGRGGVAEAEGGGLELTDSGRPMLFTVAEGRAERRQSGDRSELPASRPVDMDVDAFLGGGVGGGGGRGDNATRQAAHGQSHPPGQPAPPSLSEASMPATVRESQPDARAEHADICGHIYEGMDDLRRLLSTQQLEEVDARSQEIEGSGSDTVSDTCGELLS